MGRVDIWCYHCGVANVELTSCQWHKILTFLRSRSDLYSRPRRPLPPLRYRRTLDCPFRRAEYGNWNSVYKRYAGWCDRGIWATLHHCLADDPDTEYLIIDSTVVRAHPDAAGTPKKEAVKTPRR